MPSEVFQYLINSFNGGLYVDCTFGGGGHTKYLLNKLKSIRIVAFDWDESSSTVFLKDRDKFKDSVIFVRDNFKNIMKNLLAVNVNKVDGILVDLGASSEQFNDLERGFSFNSDVLDMRMDKRSNLTAKEVINSYSREDLANIFYNYGEEYESRRIAAAIFSYRNKGKVINSASELQSIVCSVKKYRKKIKINPATKVFQALRIFVNNELENLKILLSEAPKLLSSRGRIVVISFHSLEDRIVKQNFKHNFNCGVYKIITKKVIVASHKEIKMNFRSRSAKMRVAEKIGA
jgi:16S rRNA (cytosine1402-N4)-methyltransferase